MVFLSRNRPTFMAQVPRMSLVSPHRSTDWQWPLTAALVGIGLLVATPIGSAQPANPTSQSLDLGDNQKLGLGLVRAGTFLQGSPASEVNRSDEEFQRRVTLTQDYYLGVTEVTVGQFRRFAGATNYRTESERGTSGGYGWDGTQLVQQREFNWRNPGFPQTDAHPVTGVTYDDALAFCAWLSQRTGEAFNLPTEAQWEFAARAGESAEWPGAADPDAVAWYKGRLPAGTRPVGQLKANAWGFHDLAGNAAEWCRDWYGPYPNAGDAGLTDPVTSNPPAGDKPRRVLRGGSWLREAKHARVAARYRNDPKSRNADNGFRVYRPVRPSANQPTTQPSPPPAAANVAPHPLPLDAVRPSTPINRSPVPVLAATPLSSRVSRTGISAFAGLVLSVGCVGAVVALIWVMVRRFRGSTSTPRGVGQSPVTGPAASTWIPARTLPPSAINTQLQDDGFRMLLSGVALGELVRYSARVAGEMLTETVAYEPGTTGQFIYTGTRPESVAVLGISAGSENALPGQSTLRNAGPGAFTRAGSWTGLEGGFSGMPPTPDLTPTPRPRQTDSSGRRPGAYE